MARYTSAPGFTPPSPFGGARPIGTDWKMSTDTAAEDEARHQSVMSGMNAIAGVAAAERAGDVAHEAMAKQKKGGLFGALGSVAGSVLGSVVPGVGTALGGSIGGGIGSLFG